MTDGRPVPRVDHEKAVARPVRAHDPGQVPESGSQPSTAITARPDRANQFAVGGKDQVSILSQVECGNVPIPQSSKVRQSAELSWAVARLPELDGGLSVVADRQQASRRSRVAVQEVERAVAAELRFPHPAEQRVRSAYAVYLIQIKRQKPVLFRQIHHFLGAKSTRNQDRRQQHHGNRGHFVRLECLQPHVTTWSWAVRLSI